MPKVPETYLLFMTREEWRDWLQKHHAEKEEVWLLHFKKKAAQQALTYTEGVEEALCFGWIDSLLRRIDAEKYVLRYSPRKPRSIWAESNKRRVEKLIKEGRMTDSGMEKVLQAKKNGEWEAAAAREDVNRIPLDLQLEFQKHKAAWDSFQKWPDSKKKMQLYWLMSAKKPGTREKRIRAIIGMAEANE